MLYRLLLSSNVGFYVGIAIEGFLAIAAIVLLILVLKYGLPEFEKREREPRPKKEKVPPITYALSYVSGGALGDAPAAEQYRKGAKVVLKSNMFAAPVGKRFMGWTDGVKTYSSGSKYSMPEQAVVLTARWEDIPKEEPKAEPVKYALSYVSGGALGETPAVEQYNKGEKVTLKSNMFATPEGKQFDGWTDGERKYVAGTTFAMPAQSVTFTAQWAEVAKAEPKQEAKQAVVEEKPEAQPDQQIDGGMTPDGRPIVVNVYNTTANTEKTVEKEIIHTVEKKEEDEPEEEDAMFANYTILELYGLLSDEQKKYFDKLKEAALAKPEAKLSAARNFLNIKIGKRSILKLRIRRLITVGEYSLENDILRDFRKNDPNKAGNSKIKVRPTLVAVTDESTLETALNMIDLVHKQILES